MTGAGVELPFLTLILLILAALVAGWVDAVVGGGGLVQLPALLIGLPAETPVPTIAGTNKLSSAAGTAVAAVTYARQIRIAWGVVWPLLALAAVGSAAGAQLTRFLAREQFTPLVLAVVLVVGYFTWRRRDLGLVPVIRYHGRDARLRLGLIGLIVGVWDGFIGPGTGTFFVILIVAVLGHDFLMATTLAKLANLSTNLAAIIAFAATGDLLWGLGLLMGMANVLGGLLGARTALRNGNAFVRKVFLVVIGALAIKLASDTFALSWPS